jgi:DnaJ-class molecular chaperone
MARFFCTRCGSELRHRDRFCAQCGHRNDNGIGSGEDVIVRCARCKGSGKLRNYNPPFGHIEEEMNVCPACHGSGIQRV